MRTAKKEKSAFAQKLIELRQARGLTQEELAKELGITRNAVAYYEAKARNPGMEVIQTLADYFQVPAASFLSSERISRRPGPASKLERQLEQIRSLPKEKQKAISTVLDMALQNVSAE